jgi:predicted oxidoreductase
VPTARAKVDAALEAGITLFDHADIYGDGEAEALFGRVLQEAPELRDRIVLATKGGIIIGTPYDSSAAYLQQACEASLRRLGVDVIDLYQIHRPDFLAHPREVARALTSLREQGKIREVGVSNFTTHQAAALQAHLDFPIATHQPEFSCWRYQPLRDGVLDQCMADSITPLAWSPMGGGRLGMSLEDAARDEEAARLVPLLQRLDAIAAEQGVTRGAVALAWIMVHPAGIVPILGTQRPARIREATQALSVRFTRHQWNQILEAAQGEPLP